MKHRHSMFGAAILAAVGGPVSAQSGPTIYGIVDGGIEHQRVSAGATGKATSSTQAVTGSYSASRIGFRGTEDLGGGLRAFFQIEHGFNVDDGLVTGAAFWGRKSIVGLGGPWGELSLGRDYTPAFWVQLYTDINGFSLYGNSATMSQFGITGMLRANNGVYYASPEVGGFRGRLAYSFGDERSAAPKDAGVVVAASGEYRSRTLSAGGFWQSRKVAFPANATSTASSTYAGATALYAFSNWSVDTGFTRFDPAGPDTATSGVTTGLWAGVMVKFGLSDLRLNVGRIRTTLTGPIGARSTVVGLNYNYNLSKRSNLYAAIGRVDNNPAAQVSLEAGTRPIAASNGRGSDPSAVTIGIRHTF
jgi:GBP family porin